MTDEGLEWSGVVGGWCGGCGMCGGGGWLRGYIIKAANERLSNFHQEPSYGWSQPCSYLPSKYCHDKGMLKEKGEGCWKMKGGEEEGEGESCQEGHCGQRERDKETEKERERESASFEKKKKKRGSSPSLSAISCCLPGYTRNL